MSLRHDSETADTVGAWLSSLMLLAFDVAKFQSPSAAITLGVPRACSVHFGMARHGKTELE
jgi:hypothetical protein